MSLKDLIQTLDAIQSFSDEEGAKAIVNESFDGETNIALVLQSWGNPSKTGRQIYEESRQAAERFAEKRIHFVSKVEAVCNCLHITIETDGSGS